jgi:integrase
LRRASDFTVYVRGGGIWYVQWLSRKGKRYWKSTGERVQPKLKDRGQKAALCAAAVIIGSGLRSHAPVLAEYAKDFYRWETSSFIKRQHAKGRGFSRAWANALRRILVEAESEGLILRNPLNHVEPMGKGGRVRDVFALERLRRMFPPGQEELVAVWKTLKYAALFITMATTGIREGEARALQWQHVLPDGWLLVERAVKIDGTIGPLKKRERTGEPRVVALPSRAQETLNWWRQESPFALPNDLIFFGDRADHPLNRRTFADLLNGAILKAGVVRGARYLTAHSLRHTYNTAMRRAIPADTLMALMGHRDSRMSEHYDHPRS